MSETDSRDASGAAPGARLFNMETMSGVFPGTRTQVFQRVRLRFLAPNPAQVAEEWAQLLWRESPPTVQVLTFDMQSGRAGSEPLATIAAPQPGELGATLQQTMAAHGRQLSSCGTCLHWRPDSTRTNDGIALGACTLRRAGEEAVQVPPELAAQSLLALDCPAWTAHPAGSSAQDPTTGKLPIAPLPKIAEISDSKKPWAQRMAIRLRRSIAGPTAASPLDLAPSESLVERSGVGAGTEPCFACQGRIANLGALAVATPEGDKQTFSVWRCRLCFTLYLSDWIDRWERVDSLETEETIYRIAPVEAAEMLTLIGSVAGGDHPRLRRERGAQRTWVLEQLEQRPVLSHVIKQGR